MRKFYLASILAVLSGAVFAGTSHHWTLKEGEGSKVIKDSTGTLNGKLVGDVAWAREDDRGWFLNYKGGRAEIASSADLNYPEGVIAQIHFSVNLAEIKKPWTCLFSRGVNYSRGWAVMISRDGKDLMVGLCGMKPGYRTVHANIQSNVDYKLVLLVGDGKVQLLLNGKLLNQYSVSGTLAEKPDKLYLGGNLGYPFAGNIYDFKVMPFSKESVQKLLPAGGNATPGPASLMPVKTIKYPALNFADPKGTVKVYDFKKFSPQPDSAKNGWLFRDNMHFVVPWAGVLNSAQAPDSVPLTYDPELKGEYDVYAGVRTYTGATSIIVAVGNDNYRISLPGTGSKTHYNIEQIIARKVDMTGKKISLQSTGERFTISYLKFIPSKNARAKDYPPFPGAKVEAVEKVTAESIEKKFAEKIATQVAAGHFSPRFYEEKTPMPKVAAASSKRGFMLFNRNWMDMVWSNTVPAADPGNITLHVAATPGETVPTAFALRSLRDLSKVNVKQLTAFKSSAGQKAVTAADIRVVESAIKRTTHFSGRSEFMDMPYYLEPIYAMNIKQGVSKSFFLLLKFAENTPPGDYSADFAVEADGIKTIVPVKATVYPFVLSNIKDLYFGYWTSVSANSNEARKIIQDQALSANSIVVNSSTLLRLKRNQANGLMIDWDNSVFVALADEMKKQKMDGRIFLMTQYIWDQCKNLPDTIREKNYIALIQDIMAKAKAENWPEIVFNSFDEVLSQPEHLPAFIQEVKLQKQAGAKTANDHIWYKTSRPWQKEVDMISSSIDIFINRYNTRNLWYVDDWKTMMQTARKKNVELIAYNSNNALTCSQPAAMRFAAGWFQRSPEGNGCKGQLTWIWHSFSGSPLNDLDGTDWTYIVPPYKGKKGGPTYDLMGMRAGYSDMRYIKTLEETIVQAKKVGKNTADAEKLLTELSASFDCGRFLKESVFFNSSWSEMFEKDGKRYASGVLNLPNGWNLDDYDKNRAKIAAAIIALQKK